MSTIIFKKHLLATSIAVILSGTAITPVVAAEQEKSVADDVETIEVRGIRRSLQKSMNTKRFANSVVDAVTAEDIGKFPDKNVAESLQRISGVSIDRNFGEGERISIRGTSPNQNRTLLNGQNVGSADWWISSKPSRGFNFTMLPSELVKSLEVYKSPEADIDEGSIGGTVILRTRTPLDMESGKFVGSVQAQYSEVSGETDPQVSGLYSWKNDDENFGILASYVRHQRNLRRDGLEAWSWGERSVKNGNPITLEDGAVIDNVYAPGGGGSALFKQERVRNTANLVVEWVPTDNLNVTFNGLYSLLAADNNNQNFLWLPGYGGSQYQSITTEQHPVVGNIWTGGTLGLSPDGNNTLYETIARDSEIDTQYYDFKVEHQGEIWDSSYHVGYTSGSGGTQADRRIGWEGNTRQTYDTSVAEDVKVSYLDLDPDNAADWNLAYIRKDQNDTNDKELFAQSDFSRELDMGIITGIKTGVKFRNHSRDFIRFDAASQNPGWNLADYSLPFPSDYLSGIASTGTLSSYAYTDVAKASAEIDNTQFATHEVTASTFDINEKIYAAYVKAELEGEGFRGNMGMRVVRTEQSSAAFVGSDWTEIDRDYTDFLPSINLAFDLDEDVILRIAAARVMSRPEYNHMTASTSYNLETLNGSGGNPNIDPFRANQFDVGVEWYFTDSSLFSFGLFQKDIQSFTKSNMTFETIEGVDGVAITRPENGNGGKIQGFELSYQHEFLEGVGIVTNYTYVDGKAKDGETGNNVTIPGNSRHTANASTYYENDVMSARISYNYRTGYDTGLGWPGYIDDYGQLDASLSYDFNENLTFVVEATNLTDEHTFSYQQEGVKIAPTSVYHDGRRFAVGVRFDF